MHNNPDKREKYFRDLNVELDEENKLYEKRILALKMEYNEDKNKKIKYLKAVDKMNQIKTKVKQNLDKEEKKKKVNKIKKGVHKNLKSFITDKIQQNEKIRSFKQKQKRDLDRSRRELNLDR